MHVKVGSDNYFKANQQELVDIKGITAGDKNWFVKKACKMMKSIRKAIYGYDKLAAEYNARLIATKKSIRENQYKINIEKYVDGVVDNCKKEAYNSFIAGMPIFNTLMEKNADFVDGLGANPNLNNALNAICGDVRIDACTAFDELSTVLNKINTENANTPFLQFVQELKDQFKDGAETKKHLDSNLKNIKAALSWDWKKAASRSPFDASPIEKVLGDDQKDHVGLLKHVVEWQNKLQRQQDALLAVLPGTAPANESRFLKRYGYFTDQIDAVKRVSERQMKEVSSQKKLEASLISFLSDKVKIELANAEKSLGDIKTGSLLGSSKAAIKKNKTDIAEVKSKLKSMRSMSEDDTKAYQIRSENLSGLTEDLGARKDLHRILKSEWYRSFQPIKSEIKREYKACDKVKGNARAQISTLIDILKDSEKLAKDLKSTEKIYNAKDKWDIIYFRYYKTDPANKVSVQWLDSFEANINELRKDLNAIPESNSDGISFKNFFGTNEIITHKIAIEKLDELLIVLKDQKTAIKK